ncbi:hypothetical protein ACFQFS_14185 [Novosphingobium lubricantis]
MTVAIDRLSDLAAWLAKSSASRKTPMGGGTLVGPYAVIVPCDFSELPDTSFDANALPLFVSADQVEGLDMPPITMTAPASQDRAAARLAHIAWRIEAGTLPPCAVVPLSDPQEPISAAVERAGADGLDVTAFPVLAAPLWAFSDADRNTLRLPLLPP